MVSERQMEDDRARIDVLLKMYEEHAQQARQHETQRERMTYIILFVSGVLITFIASNGLQPNSLIASAILIVLGVYGWAFSLKHYERNRLHTRIMKAFRDSLEQATGLPITGLRAEGANQHKADYTQHSQSSDDRQNIGKKVSYWIFRRPLSWIFPGHLYHFWAGLPLLLAVFGLLLSVLIVASWFSVP